jgi:hypothetical protein
MGKLGEVNYGHRGTNFLSESISEDADKIVSGLLVCKPLADEVYNKLRVLALKDEEEFRNNRYQERVKANNNWNCGG